MPALAKYLNLLDDLIEDDEFAQSFVWHVLPQWELHREEATELAESFEFDMSPQRLFECSPLCHCGKCTKPWLGTLMHMLWLGRYPVRQWIAEAAQAIDNTNSAYERLQATLQDRGNSERIEPSGIVRTSFAEFRDRCQIMANALSNFPSEVTVV